MFGAYYFHVNKNFEEQQLKELEAKRALKSQDEVMSLNLTGHKYVSEQTKKVTNFQREFDNYLSSFGDMLTLAASIYGIYYQVDQTLKNLKELKSVGVSCPANVLAVALSQKKNNIYKDVIDTVTVHAIVTVVISHNFRCYLISVYIYFVYSSTVGCYQ